MEGFLKPGGGGKPQFYIPKGNGTTSGEYSNTPSVILHQLYKSRALRESNEFCYQYNCTEKDLRVLNDLERFYIIYYSDFRNGTSLNNSIRNKYTRQS